PFGGDAQRGLVGDQLAEVVGRPVADDLAVGVAVVGLDADLELLAIGVGVLDPDRHPHVLTALQSRVDLRQLAGRERGELELALAELELELALQRAARILHEVGSIVVTAVDVVLARRAAVATLVVGEQPRTTTEREREHERERAKAHARSILASLVVWLAAVTDRRRRAPRADRTARRPRAGRCRGPATCCCLARKTR